MAKIYVFDSWKKFWSGLISRWREQGHEVKTGPYWGPDLVEWSDISIFHPVQDNLQKASKKQEKPPNTIIIAEAIDVDIYAGHPGAVNWSYVDHLVFMSDHMREYAEKRFKSLPANLPRHVIPGGIDLDKFMLKKAETSGCEIAWIGRLWIAKNIFSAFQIFNQLIQERPDAPWRLHIRDDGKYHPPTWWKRHCNAYLKANPALAKRIIWTPRAKDMNEWLEDKDFLLQTSFKEAFAYCVGEAAAKGIQPVIQMTTGVLDIWPEDWVFQTHSEAVDMIVNSWEFGKNVGEAKERFRAYIAGRYPLEARVKAFSELVGL